jgi:hypothetical protein
VTGEAGAVGASGTLTLTDIVSPGFVIVQLSLVDLLE